MLWIGWTGISRQTHPTCEADTRAEFENSVTARFMCGLVDVFPSAFMFVGPLSLHGFCNAASARHAGNSRSIQSSEGSLLCLDLWDVAWGVWSWVLETAAPLFPLTGFPFAVVTQTVASDCSSRREGKTMLTVPVAASSTLHFFFLARGAGEELQVNCK